MIYFCNNDKNEGVLTTCSTCGSDAVYTDNGLKCTNEDCKNS